MSSQAKILHVLGLIVAMILIVGPALVTGFTAIGLPGWAHAVSAIVGLLGIPLIRQLLPIPTTSAVARMKTAVLKATPPAILFGFALLLLACAAAQTIANVGVTVAGDVCKLIAQDDPTAPTWVQVACTVEGVAGPVVVSLPWSSWTGAQGQTLAMAKAKLAAHK